MAWERNEERKGKGREGGKLRAWACSLQRRQGWLGDTPKRCPRHTVGRKAPQRTREGRWRGPETGGLGDAGEACLQKTD